MKGSSRSLSLKYSCSSAPCCQPCHSRLLGAEPVFCRAGKGEAAEGDEKREKEETDVMGGGKGGGAAKPCCNRIFHVL